MGYHSRYVAAAAAAGSLVGEVIVAVELSRHVVEQGGVVGESERAQGAHIQVAASSYIRDSNYSRLCNMQSPTRDHENRLGDASEKEMWSVWKCASSDNSA